MGSRSPASWAPERGPRWMGPVGKKGAAVRALDARPFGAGVRERRAGGRARSQSPARRVGRKGSRPRQRAGDRAAGAGTRAGEEERVRAEISGLRVCRAMAPAGAGCRGHSRGSPRPPPARPACGPSRVPVSPCARAGPPLPPAPALDRAHLIPAPHSAHSRLPPFKPEAGGGENPAASAPPRCRIPRRARTPRPWSAAGALSFPPGTCAPGPLSPSRLRSPASSFRPPARVVPLSPFLSR